MRRHDAFVANLSPETFVEQVADAAKDTKAAMAKCKLRGKIPDSVGGNEKWSAVLFASANESPTSVPTNPL